MKDIENNKVVWDEIADVVIIGSGFAGLTAAIEAHNYGASVIILEKMNAPGGNSIISDGGIAAAGTTFQKKLESQTLRISCIMTCSRLAWDSIILN